MRSKKGLVFVSCIVTKQVDITFPGKKEWAKQLAAP